ncbi:MAG: THUMP domain-containing class I SAM-dependent RNA methyltransferase [Formosimonas sp.]
MSSLSFFAPCPRGLEHLLAAELQAINASHIKPTHGGVAFAGDLAVMYRANLHSRIASRILLRLGQQGYKKEDDVYNLVARMPWSSYFSPDQTIKVEVTAIKSPLKSLEFITLRVKDAVCDYFRDLMDVRPSVDTAFPDVRIYAFLSEFEATIYLDTSGEALFKRGWRFDKGRAPLRENLAAGLIMLSGWQPNQPLLDPMCGSGTIVIEAGLIAAGIPAGWQRMFAFEKYRNFDQTLWDKIRNDVVIDKTPRALYASDISAHAVRDLENNLNRAQLPFSIAFEQNNVLKVLPPAANGVLISNPPYGERIDVTTSEETTVFFKQWADHLKANYAGWNAYILTSDRDTPKYMRLSPSKKTPLYNGALDCRLFEFKMVAGSARKDKPVEPS